jgi:hypothetical protein
LGNLRRMGVGLADGFGFHGGRSLSALSLLGAVIGTQKARQEPRATQGRRRRVYVFIERPRFLGGANSILFERA